MTIVITLTPDPTVPARGLVARLEDEARRHDPDADVTVVDPGADPVPSGGRG